jgi:recombinational DNA repair protein RecR
MATITFTSDQFVQLVGSIGELNGRRKLTNQLEKVQHLMKTSDTISSVDFMNLFQVNKSKEKKTPSSRMLFVAEKRSTFEPGIGGKQQLKMAFELWKEMSDEEKEKEMFVSQKRSTFEPGIGGKQQLKMAFELWKEMSDEEKKLFVAEKRSTFEPGIGSKQQFKMAFELWKERSVTRELINRRHLDLKNKLTSSNSVLVHLMLLIVLLLCKYLQQHMDQDRVACLAAVTILAFSLTTSFPRLLNDDISG